MIDMTIEEALAEATRVLRDAGMKEARRDAASLLMHALARDRAFLITHSGDALAFDQLTRFRRMVVRRAEGVPIQHIKGEQEFYGLMFEVTPDVLIPRPETELLVEKALELLRETTAPFICDVGTGSGCIAVALLDARADARALALDISPSALQIAARNAARHGVSARLELFESDCFTAIEATGAAFDMVVSNPPYIAEDELTGLEREVSEHEPRSALTPGGDGLGIIRRLLADTPRFLNAHGHLLFEIGWNQHDAVRGLIDPDVWTLIDVYRDLQSIPRTVVLRKK